MASARLRRWAILLSAYDYSIQHRPGKSHANADTFSRLPLSTTTTSASPTRETVLLFECLSVAPLTVTATFVPEPIVIQFCLRFGYTPYKGGLPA